MAVQVIDRGRVPGGRMSSRHIDGRYVDTGASYLVARDHRFVAVVEDWQRRGLARPWTSSFNVATSAGLGELRPGPTRWGAPGGLRSLVADLAAGLVVQQSVEVATVSAGPAVDGVSYDAVVLAMPGPQARRLIADELVQERESLSATTFDPVISLSAGWPDRSWPDSFDGAFVNDSKVLTWVADDGRRRGDGAPVLVSHSTSTFARQHLGDPQVAAPSMLAELSAVLSIAAAPQWQHVQRWTFAKPAGPRAETFHLGPAMVGLCGDGWGESKVEAAWLSGHLLAQELAGRL